MNEDTESWMEEGNVSIKKVSQTLNLINSGKFFKIGKYYQLVFDL